MFAKGNQPRQQRHGEYVAPTELAILGNWPSTKMSRLTALPERRAVFCQPPIANRRIRVTPPVLHSRGVGGVGDVALANQPPQNFGGWG
jgi:hypothetical protein